jgi:endonuclease/exonuclease/phosphatase family metal-dependent hydrolase
LPDMNTCNQIDHVIVNGKYRRSILDTRVKRGADIGSDHLLVLSKIKLKMKRTDR